MHDPRLIPLKTMTSDILKVSRTGTWSALPKVCGALARGSRVAQGSEEMTRECRVRLQTPFLLTVAAPYDPKLRQRCVRQGPVGLPEDAPWPSS